MQRILRLVAILVASVAGSFVGGCFDPSTVFDGNLSFGYAPYVELRRFLVQGVSVFSISAGHLLKLSHVYAFFPRFQSACFMQRC